MTRKRAHFDDEDHEYDATAPRRRNRSRRHKGSGPSTAWLAVGLTLGIVVLAVVVAAIVSGSRHKGPPAPPELQGTWRMVSLEKDGRKRTAGDLPYDKIVIAGDVFTAHGTDGDVTRSRVRVDATRDPKELDLVDKGWTFPAIYKIEGDTLTICINDINAPRPREFSSIGLVGTGGLATYRRETR